MASAFSPALKLLRTVSAELRAERGELPFQQQNLGSSFALNKNGIMMIFGPHM